jgi:ElaB/YqjD/DUF883 family membrane-anchored ribosome-binding protein
MTEKTMEAAGAKGAEGIAQDMQALKQDLNHLRSDIRDLLQTLAGSGKRKLEEAREAIRDQGQAAVDRTRGQILERPLTSVAVVALAGLLVGSILGLALGRHNR